MSSPIVAQPIPAATIEPHCQVVKDDAPLSSAAENKPRSPADKESGSRQTSVTNASRPSVSVVRKRLPWLENSQAQPTPASDNIELGRLPASNDEPRKPSSSPAEISRTTPQTVEVLCATQSPSLGANALLRDVSVPAIPAKDMTIETKDHSAHSQNAPLVVQPPSRGQERLQPLANACKPPPFTYASSEYSTTPSSAMEVAPWEPLKKESTPNDRSGKSELVAGRETGQSSTINHWIQSGLDLSLAEPLRPSTAPATMRKGTSTLKPTKSLHPNIGDSSRLWRPSDQDKSTHLDVEPRKLRKARTAPDTQPVSLPDESSPSPFSAGPPLAKKPTLHMLPAHLLAPSSSSSQVDVPRVLKPKTTPMTTRNAVHAPGPLNRTVSDLENLMEEALNVAKDAAKSGRSEDVATILNNATLALRKANLVSGSIGRPLVLSPAESTRSSEAEFGDSRSDLSSRHNKESSGETLPTIFTKSANSSRQPILTRSHDAHKSQKAIFGHHMKSNHRMSSGDNSMSPTPPRLYQPASADSIVRDFAYKGKSSLRRHVRRRSLGAAADYYGDQGESVTSQPGVRRSIVTQNKGYPMVNKDGKRGLYQADVPLVHREPLGKEERVKRAHAMQRAESVPVGPANEELDLKPMDSTNDLRSIEHKPTNTVPQRVDSRLTQNDNGDGQGRPQPEHQSHHFRLPAFLESSYYRENGTGTRKKSGAAGTTEEARYGTNPTNLSNDDQASKTERYSDQPSPLTSQDLSLKHPRRKHISLNEGQGFSLGRYHKRQPIAREWNLSRKRLTATIACLNTIFLGLIAGIYAGEVPRIQYQIADQNHTVLLGNVLLFSGLGLTTIIFWPLPLLHGRKPYILLAFALMLPLQFPQALAVSSYRNPNTPLYRVGLLVPRALTGLALGFANINFLPTLFDLFGVSLMSERPHQEIVVYDDVRRQGGGMGIWLGVWTFCFSSSLSIGFCVGACIISRLDPSWGFYVVVILLAVFLLINVIAPETRRAPYRRSIAHFFDDNDPDKLKRRVARGEVKLHISNDGPKWWFDEVWAGLVLTKRMVFQPGFFVLMCYLGWVIAQLTLVILLLGALLSRDYQWQSQYVGLAALAVPVGAILALPLTKASWLSRSRVTPPRTDSMTFQPRVTWTSHLVRRAVFSLILPFAGLAYCLSASGPPLNWAPAVIFSGLVGFLTDLATAECVGLIMETFDTCDLQPGVNTKHRLQSMSSTAQRRRTNYSSFPRVCAGFFAAQSLGFFLAAAATGVSGSITRSYGAETAISITAAVLLFVTLFLLLILWRWRDVQVIPNYTNATATAAAATRRGSKAWGGAGIDDPEWKPVIIGNPSGKMRRMNILEMGSWTRWTEIRKLNKLVRE